MTDLKGRLAQLLGDEPEPPYDIERIVTAGRRSRRRHQAALATAGTLGAAGLTAAVVIPVVGSGGNEATVKTSDQPSAKPNPTSSAGRCYYLKATGDGHQAIQRLMRSGMVGNQAGVKKLGTGKNGKNAYMVCSNGEPAPVATEAPEVPAGPRYHYTEEPSAIAARLEAALHHRVTAVGLDITFTRPFAQETDKLDDGHPSYFGGNVDVHEPSGYADIGVQVTHKTTEQVPFDSECSAAEHCEETTLPDGSVLRTEQVKAGQGDIILTAEVHRPDGTVVQAQESNYPFGPDAGSQPHGDQPLSPDQLFSLAEDPDFTF